MLVSFRQGICIIASQSIRQTRMAVMITVLLGLTLMLEGALSQTRPVIPNSFMMMAEVGYFGGVGQVQIAYDFEGGNVSQIFQMANCVAAVGSFAQFGAGVADIVIQVGPILGCIPQTVPKIKPTAGMWDWVKTAIYEGQTVIAGLTLDVWAANISGSAGGLKVGVTPDSPNQPKMLMQAPPNAVDQDMLFIIIDFAPGAPPSSAFEIPPTVTCPPVGQQLMQNADHPSLIMPPFMMDPTVKVFKKMIDLGKH